MGGTYAGAWLARLLPATVQLVLFAGVMLLAAWMMFRNAPHGSNDIDAARPRQAIWKITLEGLAVGVVTGVVGVGGGFLIVPALVLLCGLPMPAAVGTSLMVIALNAFTGLIKYHDVLAGLNVTVDWTTVGWFAGIGIVGMLVGRRVGQNMPRRRAFSVLLVVMAGFVLSREVPKALARTSAPAASTSAREDEGQRVPVQPVASVRSMS